MISEGHLKENEDVFWICYLMNFWNVGDLLLIKQSKLLLKLLILLSQGVAPINMATIRSSGQGRSKSSQTIAFYDFEPFENLFEVNLI